MLSNRLAMKEKTKLIASIILAFCANEGCLLLRRGIKYLVLLTIFYIIVYLIIGIYWFVHIFEIEIISIFVIFCVCVPYYLFIAIENEKAVWRL